MHKKFDKSSNSNRKFPNKEDILKLEPSVEQIEEVKELIEQVDLEHYFANWPMTSIAAANCNVDKIILYKLIDT